MSKHDTLNEIRTKVLNRFTDGRGQALDEHWNCVYQTVEARL